MRNIAPTKRKWVFSSKQAILLFSLALTACAPTIKPTPEVIVVTVVVAPTIQPATPTALPTPSPTATPNPCILADEVKKEMAGQTLCVRGIIHRLDYSDRMSHWDLTESRTGFFAVSKYLGWHPATGKGMAVGDCVAITGTIQVLSSGRPFIYWGEVSIFKSSVDGNTSYYEHPDLLVIEDNPSYCMP